MAVPTAASYSDSQISVAWLALVPPADGNSAVLTYELLWDNGGGSGTTLQLAN
jgi:hypothetical protein